MRSNISIPRPAGYLIWQFYCWMGFLQGLTLLVFISRMPVSVGTRLILGMPLFVLVNGLVSVVTLFVFGWLVMEGWIKPVRSYQRVEGLKSFVQGTKTWGYSLLVLVFVFSMGCYFISLVPEVGEPFARSYFDRLLPLALLATGLSVQTIVAALLLRNGWGLFRQGLRSRAFYAVLFSIGLLFLAWAWVAQRFIPSESKITGWNSLGAPILETQLLIAWAAGMLLLFLISRADRLEDATRGRFLKSHSFDILIGVLLWIVAIFLWQSAQLVPNWFVSKPQPPNYEFYPNSDARAYDLTAQLAIVGEGFIFFNSPYVRRPLHAGFLTLLHQLVGQNYLAVIFLQLVFLAILPVLIYFLTLQLHNRVSAVIAAVAILLREMNSISLAGRVTTSNAKTLMADLPATILVILFVYVASIWFKGGEGRIGLALLAGAALGVSVLIRPETLIFLFVILTIALLHSTVTQRKGIWLGSMGLFCLGLALVLIPWVWRNWQRTGLVFLDTPLYHFDLIAQRYRSEAKPTKTFTPEVFATQAIPAATGQTPSPSLEETQQTIIPKALPTPTISSPSAETPQDFIRFVAQRAINYVLSNPGEVSGFILTHYLNSQMQELLVLPTTFRGFDSFTSFLGHRSTDKFALECCSALSYIRRLPYWHKWDGYFPRQAMVPLFINSLLIALGIDLVWKRYRWIGVLPLVFSTIYLLLNAIFRNSGGRYILPVDWVGVIYFSIGLAHLSSKVVAVLLGKSMGDEVSSQSLSTSGKAPARSLLKSPSFYLLLVGIFLFGCLLPVIERRFPQLYSPARRDEMLASLWQSDIVSPAEQQAMETFLANGGIAYAGRALYPTFYPAFVGDPGTRGARAPKAYPRLVFSLAGPGNPEPILPMQEAPRYFPNAVDVLVFACPDERALAAAVFNTSGAPIAFYVRTPLPEMYRCPLP